MKLFVIEPKLSSRRGHYFHTDLAIDEGCRARNIPIEILANRAVDDEIVASLPVRPLFSVSADPDDRVANDFFTGNELVERDLERDWQARLGPEDLILVPSPRDNNLGGIRRWYASLPVPRPPICIRLIVDPGFGVREGGRPLAPSLAVEQLRAWRPLVGADVRFAAETRELAAFYETVCGFQVIPLPMLLRSPLARAPEPSPVRNSPHIVFLGEGRPEKGFHLLPDALSALLARHPEVRLTLQTGPRFDVDPRVVGRWRALSPHVSIVGGPLPPGHYDDLLLSSDIVLVTYDPDFYARRTSLIFWEAIGAGKVTLTTRGTHMHRQLQSMGIGDICAETFSSEAITDGVQRLLADWPRLAERARRAAPDVRQQHNPGRFVDELLAAMGRPADHCGAIGG